MTCPQQWSRLHEHGTLEKDRTRPLWTAHSGRQSALGKCVETVGATLSTIYHAERVQILQIPDKNGVLTC